MITLICLLIGFALLPIGSHTSFFNLLVFVVIAITSAGFLYDVCRSRKLAAVRNPLIIGYVVRLIFLLYDVYTENPFHLPLVGGPMTEDPARFYSAASTLAAGGESTYGGTFSHMFGFIFKITGPSRLWCEFLVMMFSAFTLIVIAHIVMELDIAVKDKRMSMYFACLMPNYILLSVIFRRETIITLCLALSLLFFMQWARKTKGELAFILAMLFALLASLFHGATGIIVVFYLMVHFIYNPLDMKFRLSVRNMVIVVLFGAAFMLVYARYGTVFFSKLDRFTGNIETLSSVRDAGGSSYAQYVGNSNSILNIIIYSLPRYVFFMYSPFPWQWRSISDIMAFLLSSVPYLLILIRSIRSIRKTHKDDPKRVLLIILVFVTVSMTFIFSWGVTNTGTATRHRDKFIALYAVLFALSRDERIRIKAGNGRFR